MQPFDLIAPLFVVDEPRSAIESLPGQFRLPIDEVVQEASELYEMGARAVALFPVIRHKDVAHAVDSQGLIPRAIRALKQQLPDLMVVADVALDPFTPHGHDGLVEGQKVLNDETVEVLARMAVVLAEAGADVIAPSDMMDGRVGAIRRALDAAGHQEVIILSYTAKYASGLYGPFRDALRSHLAFGDKRSYQMDPANARDALVEAQLDEQEGADILMVKPATLYLDVIAALRKASHLPIAAYHVSGEWAMIQAAAPWLDVDAVLMESLTAIKRAGADLIITYGARRALELLQGIDAKPEAHLVRGLVCEELPSCGRV